LLCEATGAKSVFGEPAGIECADIFLEDGDELEFGHFILKAIATPGHTGACTSFYTEGML
jgi:glyoxylase-like metal-dependent hydrolase (beta-lactamase superfamily II)